MALEINLEEIEKANLKVNSAIVDKFENFFKVKYRKEIERLVGNYPEKKSLNIDFAELDRFDPELADALIVKPDSMIEGAKEALQRIDIPSLELSEFKPNVRFFNLPRELSTSPLLRDIGAEHLGRLVSIEGVVRQITDVLPRLLIGMFECKRCGNTYKELQEGQELKRPLICECKAKEFRLLQDGSVFEDYQKIQIQEPLERLRGHDQPTTLNVFISDDLVNKLSAGDKTRFVGILRLMTPKDKKLVYGRYLEAVHLEETSKEFGEVEVSKEEEEEIKKLAGNEKVYEILIQSIAPNIYGHETIKEAIALQLFGGVHKTLPNETTIRGNIHVLVVGDPGMAKSQLLMAANKIAPKSIYVAGKSSSGVGLCVGPKSKVLNSNGFKNIEEFVEERFNEKNAVEEIKGAWNNHWSEKTFSLNNLKLKESEIEKIWRIKAPEKMYKIKTQYGKELEITPNTPLIILKENKFEWIKSKDIKEGDLIAGVRKIPEGKAKNIEFIPILMKSKHGEQIRIEDNISELFKKITDKLAKKYGSLQSIAKSMNVSRDTIYASRNPNHYHGVKLREAMRLAEEAEMNEELLDKVSKVFIRYGKTIKIPKYIDNEELAYLAGLIIGDGDISSSKERSHVRLSCSDKELHSKFKEIIEKHFNVKTDSIESKEKVKASRVKYLPVYELVKAFGARHKKTESTISHSASEMPNKVLSKLVQGLMDTDGYVSVPTKKRGSSHAGISSISEELIQNLQLCLLKFGIISKIRKRKKAGQVAVGKKIKVKSNHDAHVLEIRGKENLEIYRKEIGFALARKQEKLINAIKKIGEPNPNLDLVPFNGKMVSRKTALEHALKEKNKELELIASSDVIWEKVAEKKEFTPEYKFVYDYTVKNTHNFIANGIIVHNTASAVKDDFGEGGWTLKAGALVLASGGCAFIDEFDKMDPEDRSAMHEAMEQGRVSVAKAGIVSTFKTDTTILAAANPKYARFDAYQSYLEQIDLPPTLLSRFDLFFPIKDVLDRKKDEEISNHILQTHKAGEMMLQAKHSGRSLTREDLKYVEETITPLINIELLKKFISYARQNVFPVLEKDSIKAISDFYLNLRDQGRKEGNYSATHRQLEGIIRLSEASARVRLSDIIEMRDIERAIKLFRLSMEEVVTDMETGKIDIDIITSGTTHTQTSNMKKILKIVKDLAETQDMVSIDQLTEQAEHEGIEKDKVREFVSQLKKKGDLYEPRHNFLKPTSKK